MSGLSGTANSTEPPGSLLPRWLALCPRLGLSGDGLAAGGALVSRYGEPQRHYHDLRHVAECLETLDGVSDSAQDRDAVEVAIWFHDAVYQIGTTDSETRSAALAVEVLGSLQADAALVDKVAALIRATDHRQPPSEGDAALICDIDLSILGAPPERYDEYAAAIQRETGLSDREFARPRGAFLQSMLSRERIYSTERFRQRLERAARENMQRELARWRAIPDQDRLAADQ